MVKSALRCASPEQEVQGLSGLRSSSDGPEAAEPPQKQRKKEFAWMDSDDEVSDSPAKVPRAEASSPKRSPESDGSGSEPEVPESAKDVQSLAQMMRLMECLGLFSSFFIVFSSVSIDVHRFRCVLQGFLAPFDVRLEVLAAATRQDPATAHGRAGTGT